MTRVCLVGDPDVNLQYELLSRETSREALSTYELERPFANSIAVRTVSVGAAVSLCNDLQWYIVRFVDEVLVQEPSISEREWLSRELAEAIRNDAVDPASTAEYLKIFGLEYPDAPDRGPPGDDGDSRRRDTDGSDGTGLGPDSESSELGSESSGPGSESPGPADPGSNPDAAGARVVDPPRLVEPLYVRRDGDSSGTEATTGQHDSGDPESGAAGTVEPDESGSDLPEYDLRDVDETLVVRLTEAEFTP